MIICDKCRKPFKTKIVVFGQWIVDKDLLPSWDLCDECEKSVLEKLNTIIGEKGRTRR
jgi:hypothetical protein